VEATSHGRSYSFCCEMEKNIILLRFPRPRPFTLLNVKTLERVFEVRIIDIFIKSVLVLQETIYTHYETSESIDVCSVYET
jgi:hypothetical protein